MEETSMQLRLPLTKQIWGSAFCEAGVKTQVPSFSVRPGKDTQNLFFILVLPAQWSHSGSVS